jgi:hypothetical protein
MTTDITLGVYALTDPRTDPNSEAVDPSTPGAQYWPVSFSSGQGDVADGTIPLGDGTRIPGFSNGTSAQVGGVLSGDLGTSTLGGGSTLSLLNSGSWQPGDSVSGAPLPANLGIFFDPANPDNAAFPLTIVAALSNAVFDLTSTNFLSDPSAVLTMSGAHIAGVAVEFNANFDDDLASVSTNMPLNGILVGDQLTLPIATQIQLSLEDAIGLPLFVGIQITGQVVATVPEPSTFVMLGVAGIGLCLAGRRRIRNRS